MHVKLSKGDARVWVKFGKEYDTTWAKRTTTIRLTIGEETVSAVAICSRKDNFCKRTGRKTALQKLLANNPTTFASYHDRKAMWQAVCPEFFKGPNASVWGYRLNIENAFLDLLLAARKAASAPGQNWLEEQVKLAKVIQRIEGKSE